MFDFIRKPTLWASWDMGIDKELGAHSRFHLKSIQDLVVYKLLRGSQNLDVAEVGRR